MNNLVTKILLNLLNKLSVIYTVLSDWKIRKIKSVKYHCPRVNIFKFIIEFSIYIEIFCKTKQLD